MRTLARIALVVVVSLLALELVWRGYLWTIGHGFFDAPESFRSPFITGYDPPWPVVRPGTLIYRNGEVAVPKPADEIRVVCFGGSTTVSLSAGVSYPELLEPRLANVVPGRRVRILNAGSEGFASPHTLVNLALRNLEAQPDVIVVYENINDSSALYFGETVVPDYANKYLTPTYLAPRHRTDLLAAVTRVSRVARYLAFRWGAYQYAAWKKVSDEELERGLMYFRRNLESIVAVARAHGARVLLASQAAKTKLRTDPVFAAYNRAIAEVAAATGVAYVDVAAAVVDDAAFLTDLIHNTRHGVEELAAALEAPIEALVREAAAARP